jgi:hypothetical protein
MEYSRLLEVLKIGDLTRGKGTSDFTKYFQNIRQHTLGSESALASCDRAGFGKNKDDVVFVFSTPAGSENAKRVNAKSFRVDDNPSSTYTLWICVTNCLSALKTIKGQLASEEENDLDLRQPTDSEEQTYEPEETEDTDTETNTEEDQDENATDRPEDDPEVSHPQKESRIRERLSITEDDISTIFEVCDIRLWSDSPAFHYQGSNYHLSQLDAALYPTNIKPRQWDDKHKGDNFVDKHLASLIDAVPSFFGQMAQRLQDLLNKKRIKL